MRQDANMPTWRLVTNGPRSRGGKRGYHGCSYSSSPRQIWFVAPCCPLLTPPDIQGLRHVPVCDPGKYTTVPVNRCHRRTLSTPSPATPQTPEADRQVGYTRLPPTSVVNATNSPSPVTLGRCLRSLFFPAVAIHC